MGGNSVGGSVECLVGGSVGGSVGGLDLVVGSCTSVGDLISSSVGSSSRGIGEGRSKNGKGEGRSVIWGDVDTVVLRGMLLDDLVVRLTGFDDFGSGLDLFRSYLYWYLPDPVQKEKT